MLPEKFKFSNFLLVASDAPETFVHVTSDGKTLKSVIESHVVAPFTLGT